MHEHRATTRSRHGVVASASVPAAYLATELATGPSMGLAGSLHQGAVRACRQGLMALDAGDPAAASVRLAEASEIAISSAPTMISMTETMTPMVASLPRSAASLQAIPSTLGGTQEDADGPTRTTFARSGRGTR